MTTKSVFLRGVAALCLLVAFIAQKQAWAAVPPAGTPIVNVATTDYTDTSGAAMPQESGTATVTVPLSSVAIAITVDRDPVLAGEDVVFTITVTDDGTFPLTGVVLANSIPANTTYVSDDSGGLYDPATGEVTWNIGGLGVGASKVIQLVVNVVITAPGGLIITDTATVSSFETADKSASAATSVTARTPGQVVFTDITGSELHNYMPGDTVYVQVTDLDQNGDPLVAETVTVVIDCFLRHADGTETLDDSITLTLTETGPDTGIFTGSVVSTSAVHDFSDLFLSVEADCRLRVVYTDPLDASPVYDDDAYIDPFGIVFDSVTGAPVAGASVTLIDDSTGSPAAPPAVPVGQPSTVTTLADGEYQFPFVNPGTYHLEVVPGGAYIFPSTVPDASLPPAYIVDTGSRGEPFTLALGMGPLNLDIPVDLPGGTLSITKTVDKPVASIGDLLRYTVTVRNTGAAPVAAATVMDVMPHGIIYVTGSTKINGVSAPDPASAGGTSLTWPAGVIAAGATVEITFAAAVGPDSRRGDGVNTAFAGGTAGGLPLAAVKASCKVDINEGVFTSKGTIIGKVFVDDDADGQQQVAEKGLPGVVLYMEDGTRVITGSDGKYNVIGVTPGTHVLKVDSASLPAGSDTLPASNRFMGDGSSQFVDMQHGLISKADFAVKKGETADGAIQVPEATKPAEESVGEPAKSDDELYAEKMKNMTRELEILSPADGAVVAQQKINIVVKANSEGIVTLYVNGEPVDEKMIGKKMVSPASKVGIYRYVSVSINEEEKNVIRAEMKDPFGNVRGVKEITVISPGRPVRIDVTPENAEASADGVTVTEFEVNAFDAGGSSATGNMFTVMATAGEVVNEDITPFMPGVQVLPEMGVLRIKVRSPREPKEAKITVECKGVSKTASIYFSPYLRDIIAVGVGEVVAGLGNTSGSSGYLGEDSWLNSGFYAGGRGAFFIKGGIGHGMLLTAAYDSEKKKEDVGLFHEKTGNVESEELYPIYGDESKTGYEAMSTDKLYLRIDRGKSYMMYGDYHTDLSETKLSSFRRTLNGMKAELSAGVFKLKGFASRTDRFQAVDKFQGRGIAGYYFLESAPVVDGSELVAIETRDRLQPDLVVGRRVMSRWSDYNIDYSTGGILFKEPVPSRDQDLNPVYIIVSYESEGADRHYVYGGRVSASPTAWSEVGLTGLVEENGFHDYRLTGIDTTLKLPLNTELKAEWSTTSSLFDDAGTLTPRNGNAWGLWLNGSPLEGLKLSASYFNYADFFNNPSAVEVMRGRRGYGADLTYRLSEKTALHGRFLRQDDTLNGTRDIQASAGVESELLGAKVGLEVLHQQSKDRFIPVASPDTRYPFDISEETPAMMTAIRGSVSKKLWKDLLFNLEHTQDVVHNRNNMMQAGFDYQYSQVTKLYVREQYVTLDDRSQMRTVAGIETSVAANTVMYSEYRLASGTPGTTNQHGIGLRNKFYLGRGLTGNVAVENLKSLTGGSKLNEPDAFSASLGLEYLASSDLKATTRMEYRNSTVDISRLAEMGLAYKLHRDMSLLVRGRYFDDKAADTGKRLNFIAGLGFAYRPVDNDRFNALAKAEYKRDKAPDTGSGSGTTDNYIFSAEGVYQAHRKVQLTGKYAGKYTSGYGISMYTDLVSARATCDLTDRIDLGLTYRLLTNHLTGTCYQGGAVEAGFRIIKNVWLSAGYSFDRFDSDLTGDDYQGEGPYVKLRVKFTEGLFK